MQFALSSRRRSQFYTIGRSSAQLITTKFVNTNDVQLQLTGDVECAAANNNI